MTFRRSTAAPILAVLAILLPLIGAPLWIIFVVAALEAASAQLFLASEGALLPTIIEDDRDLLAANSLLSGGVALTKLVGPPLGGLLYAVVGLGASALIDSASFALSAVAIMAIRPLARTTAEPDSAEAAEQSRQTFVAEFGDGVRCIAGSRILAVLCATIAIVMAAQGIVQTTLVPFVRSVLEFDTVEFGLLASAEGLGALVGALAVGLVSRYLTGGKVLALVLMLASLFLFGFTIARSLPLSAAFLFLGSVPSVLTAVWVQTYYQQHVDNRLLGRVIGLTDNISSLGMLGGIAAASLLGGLLGTASIMMLAGIIQFLGGIAALVFLHGVDASLVSANTSSAPDARSLTMGRELEGVGL